MKIRLIKSQIVSATGDLSVNLTIEGEGTDIETLLPEEILKDIAVELGCKDWQMLLERIQAWKAH